MTKRNQHGQNYHHQFITANKDMNTKKYLIQQRHVFFLSLVSMREEGISSIRKNHIQLHQNQTNPIKLPNIVTLQNQRTYDLITLGCLIPTMRPHSDKSSDISQPTSSYIASRWIRFVDGCTIIRATPVLSFPLCKSRAQWEGVRGALLSHLFPDSESIPTTPLPRMVYVPSSLFFLNKAMIHWAL